MSLRIKFYVNRNKGNELDFSTASDNLLLIYYGWIKMKEKPNKPIGIQHKTNSTRLEFLLVCYLTLFLPAFCINVLFTKLSSKKILNVVIGIGALI